MLRSLAAVLLVGLGCTRVDPAAARRSQLAAPHAAAAREALQRGMPERALAAAGLATAYDPLDPELRTLWLRASVGEALNLWVRLPPDRWERAEYEAFACGELEPSCKAAGSTLHGLIAFLRDQHQLADVLAQKAIATDTTFAPGHRLKALGLEAAHKPAEAVAEYELAIGHGHGRAVPFLEAGRLWLAQGDFVRAIPRLESAVSQSDSVLTRLALADAYDGGGRAAEALPHLERAVAMDQKNGPARLRLAEHLLAAQRLDEAEYQFKVAAQVGMEPFATRGMGYVHLARGKLAEAEKAFNLVLQLTPDDSATLFTAAETTEQLKKSADAVKLYERFVTAAARNPIESERIKTAQARLDQLRRPR